MSTVRDRCIELLMEQEQGEMSSSPVTQCQSDLAVQEKDWRAETNSDQQELRKHRQHAD